MRTKQSIPVGKADLAADFATLEFGLGWRVYPGFDAISVDALVGGRWAVHLTDAPSLLCRGDSGGFGAGSQLAWSLLGGFRHETPWSLGPARLNAFAAYKVYDFDDESGSGTSSRSIAEEYRGPALGLGAAF